MLQSEKHQKQIQSQMPFETNLQQVHVNQQQQDKYEQQQLNSEINNLNSFQQKDQNANENQKQLILKKERIKDQQEQDDITPIEVLQIPEKKIKQKQSKQFQSTFQQLKRADSSERLEQKLIIYPENYENWTQKDCEEIIKQEPNNIFRLYKLVQIFISKLEYTQAKEHLLKVSELDSDFEVEQVNFQLGQIFIIEKEWGKALQHLRIAYQFMQDRGKCLMAIGRCYGKLRDLDKAILKYKKAIEYNNKDPLGYYRLGWLLIKNKKMREGIDNLAKAQTLDSTNLEIIIKLGDAYIIENLLDEAVQVLHQGILLDPLNYDCMNALARAYEKQGDLQNAIHYAKQATQQPNANINSHYHLGMLYMKKKEMKLAAESFRTLLKIDSEHVDALIEYATISSIQGNYEKAKKYLKHALKLKMKCRNVHFIFFLAQFDTKSFFYVHSKQFKSTIDCFIRICRSDQNNFKAHYYMGLCYVEKKDYTTATQCMKESLKINSKFGMAWKMIGSLQYERNQPGKALKCFQKALDSDPMDLEAKIGLGNCFYLSEQFEQAIQIYEEISKFDQNEELEYNLANCYYMKNDLNNAIVHYQNALEVNPKKVECHYNLGNSYFIQENYEEALCEFKKVIDLDPKHGAALYNYANTYYVQENYEKAADYFEKAISVQPRNEEWRNYVASLYMEKGDLVKAKHHLDESYRLDPKNAETLMRMSNYFYQIGNYREAVRFAKSCLVVDEHNQEAHNLIKEFTK